MEDRNKLNKLLSNKKVLFVATKNRDYIRITQEIRIVKEAAQKFDVISYEDKKYLFRFLKVFLKLLFKSTKEYDVILVSFMPQMIVPFFKKRFRKNTLIVDFFISIYDTLVDDRKLLKDGSFLSGVCKKIDQCSIDAADYVITDTKTHGKYFCEEFNVPMDKIIPVYLEADVSFYHPMSIDKPDKLKGKMTVLYFGSILPVQGVEVVLKTIELMRDNKNIHFIMIGPIPEKYNKVMTDTVTYYDWLPQEDLASQIAIADVCLAGHFSADIGKSNRTIPGKVYIYRAMEKPIILGDSDANREKFVEESHSCYYVDRGNPFKLKEKIEMLYSKYEEKINGKDNRN